MVGTVNTDLYHGICHLLLTDLSSKIDRCNRSLIIWHEASFDKNVWWIHLFTWPCHMWHRQCKCSLYVPCADSIAWGTYYASVHPKYHVVTPVTCATYYAGVHLKTSCADSIAWGTYYADVYLKASCGDTIMCATYYAGVNLKASCDDSHLCHILCRCLS